MLWLCLENNLLSNIDYELPIKNINDANIYITELFINLKVDNFNDSD